MITLFRIIRLFQIKTKWKLALWQYADKQLMTLIKNPKEIEKKIVGVLAGIIHDENIANAGKDVLDKMKEKSK